MYKFLQSGCPKYFKPFHKPRHRVLNTSRGKVDGVVLEDQNFISVQKSSKQFGLIYAYEIPKKDLLENICSVTSLSAFRERLNIYLFAKSPFHLSFLKKILCVFPLCGAASCYVSGQLIRDCYFSL